jgi:hypothetical protein
VFYLVQLMFCILVAILTRKAKTLTVALFILPASVLSVFVSTYFLLSETDNAQYTSYYIFFWFIYGLPFIGLCFLLREMISYFENLIEG